MANYRDIEFNIIANTMVDPGMSGGNKIFIEIAKLWASQGMKIVVFTSDVGQKICEDNGLTKATFVTWSARKHAKRSVFYRYFIGVFAGLKNVAQNASQTSRKYKVIYASSDYWPDSLPAFKLKRLNPSAYLIGSLYLKAPNPFKGFREKSHWRFPEIFNIVFWITQWPIYRKILKKAQLVFVTSAPDRQRFIQAGRDPKDVLSIQGGVDIAAAQDFLRQGHNISDEPKKYDACFMGRLHPQKGPLELIDIWKRVTSKKPDAKLALIGHGALESEIRDKIKRYGLQNQIEILGFRHGQEMHKLFRASRVMLHPAVYDSGGMSAWEGMAWGLPGVGFNLPALRTYYPTGMLKAKINDFDGFAKLVLKLLTDETLYNRISQQAITGSQDWSWQTRSERVFKKMQVMFQTQL
ncbi:glycosyltransferase family 4 protein [Patescibacteria group bacterium]